MKAPYEYWDGFENLANEEKDFLIQTENEAWRTHQAGDYKKARDLYQTLTERFPSYYNGWFGLGVEFSNLKDYGKALDCFRFCAWFQPYETHCIVNAMNCCIQLQQYDFGVYLGDSFLIESTDPTSEQLALYYSNYCALIASQGNEIRAFQILKRKIEEYPEIKENKDFMRFKKVLEDNLDRKINRQTLKELYEKSTT